MSYDTTIYNYGSESNILTLVPGTSIYTYVDSNFTAFYQANFSTYKSPQFVHISGGQNTGPLRVNSAAVDVSTGTVTLQIYLASSTIVPAYYRVTTYWNCRCREVDLGQNYYKVKGETFIPLLDRNNAITCSLYKYKGNPIFLEDASARAADYWVARLQPFDGYYSFANSQYVVRPGYCPSFNQCLFKDSTPATWIISRTDNALTFTCKEAPARSFSKPKEEFPQGVVPYRLIYLLQGAGGGGSGSYLNLARRSAGGASGGLVIGVVQLSNGNPIRLSITGRGGARNLETISKPATWPAGGSVILTDTMATPKIIARANGGGTSFWYGDGDSYNPSYTLYCGEAGSALIPNQASFNGTWALFKADGIQGGYLHNAGDDTPVLSATCSNNVVLKKLPINKLSSLTDPYGTELIVAHTGGTIYPSNYGDGAGGSASYLGNGGDGGYNTGYVSTSISPKDGDGYGAGGGGGMGGYHEACSIGADGSNALACFFY